MTSSFNWRLQVLRAGCLRLQITNCVPGHFISRLPKSIARAGPASSLGKLVIVGDADKVLREHRFRVYNKHLFEVGRNSAVLDALRHLIPAFFSEKRLQQQTPLSLAQHFAAFGEGQPAVEDLHWRMCVLGCIYSTCREFD